MPHFVIYCIDKPASAGVRAENRPAHLGHLGALGDALVMAGPLLDADGGPIGSMILAEFPGEAAARRFAGNDPYEKAGLFSEVRVNQWRKALPAQ